MSNIIKKQSEEITPTNSHVEVGDFAATNHTGSTEFGGVVIPVFLLLRRSPNSKRSIWKLAASCPSPAHKYGSAAAVIIYEGGGDGRR